jgi:hypothetical protein
MSRLGFRRLSAIAIAGLVGLGALAFGVSSSRADPPVAPYLDPAYEDALWGRVSFTGSGWPATYPASWAAPQVSEVAVAAGALPPLRAVGTLWLGTGPFDMGWKINRTIDTKWLHLSGNIGTDLGVAANVRWRFGQWCGVCPEAWTLMMNTTMGALEFCNQCATRDQAGWDQQQAILDAGVGATEVDKGPSGCGIPQGVCRIVVMTEEAMAAALIHSAPETYTTQPFGYTSNIPAPVKNATNLAAARSKITELGELLQNEYNASLDPVNWPRPTEADFLLIRYAPELIYDTQEIYRADSAAEITDNHKPGENYYNELRDWNGNLLAAADSTSGAELLTLDFLGTTYPPGTYIGQYYASGYPATYPDHIDERNNYSEDFQRLNALSQYKNRVYGRVKSYPDGENTLQYWLFYYYNPKEYPPLDTGEHEGDWEMVQVLLDDSGTPTETAYAQHRNGEVCDWSFVPKNYEGRPKVFVGLGSHASYFESFTFPNGHVDTTDGDGDTANPAVERVTDATAWLHWPGTWGGTPGQFLGAASPVGPKFQGPKWDDPRAWARSSDVGACTVGAYARRRSDTVDSHQAVTSVARPAAPIVSSYRSGKRVVTRYRIPGFRRTSPRWTLLTTVDASGDRYVPLTKKTVLASGRGVVTQPLGLGKAPFRLHASVFDGEGARSKVVTVPIRK